jgi:hypothetical protein
MLLVVSLMSVVGAAVYQAAFNGLAIWRRSEDFGQEEDVFLLLEKMQVDLRNAIDHAAMPFEGKPDQISFPSVVRTRADTHNPQQRGGMVEQIGRVAYFFEEKQRCVFRRQANYSQSLKGAFGKEQILIRNVESLTLQYVYPGLETMDVKSSASGVFPSAVIVTVAYAAEDGNRQERKRFIPVFLGGARP